MAGGKVIECNTKAEWDQHLAAAQGAGKLVVVDFTAIWCGPCRMIGPYFEQLSDDPSYDKFVFLKVDVDANKEVANALDVSAMPTFMLFKDGQKVDEVVGAVKDKLKAMLDKHATA